MSEMTERSKRGSLDHDGLGSVEYEVDEIEYRPLYTSIRIKLRPPPAKESKNWLAALTDTILDNYSKGVNKMIEKVQEMEQEFVSMEENSNLKVYY